MVFEKERHIVQEFQCHLTVDTQDSAVDEDSFSGFQRNAKCTFHLSPSLMMVVTSMMPW